MIFTNRKCFFQVTYSFEAGLRDHLKSTFEKEEPNKLSIVIYKHFQWQHFENNLKSSLDNCNGNFDEYDKTFILTRTALNSHARKKDKVIRGNHEPHYDKNLWKAIMENLRLRNKANKSKQRVDIACYKIRRNFVVSLNRQSQFDYFNFTSSSKDSKPF